MAKLTVAEDEADLARRAADRLSELMAESISTRGSAVVSLTGGTTPKRLYELLADPEQPWRGRVDWPRVHLFWGDERHVPPDDKDSNYGMAKRALIDRVPIPPANVHRIGGEIPDAATAAREYADEMRKGFAAAGRQDRTFDVMLLGVGDDAHIASIFPGSPLLERSPLAARQDVTAVWAAHLDAWRITLTPQALLDARTIVMLVAGERKADAVHAAIEGPLDVARWPAQLLRRADDRLEWTIDRAAAARLNR